MSATGQPTAPCWNCGQVVQAAATTCLWCGVAVRPTVTPIVVAPSGAGAPAAVAAPAGPTAGLATPASVQAQPHQSRRAPATLDPSFAGTSATVGAQVGAFTIDVATIVVIAVGVHLAFSSALITVLASLEAMVFLWVLEARTGLTVGHLLLRVRSSRASGPFSPGAGRAFVRQTITGAGLLVAVAGAWVVAASGAWDSSGRRRSLAARASGTVAVTPPRATRTAPDAGHSSAARNPRRSAHGSGIAAPRVVSTSTLGHSSRDNSQSVSVTGAVAGPGSHVAPQLVTSLDPAREPSPASSAELPHTELPAIAPVPGMAQSQPTPAPAPAQTPSQPSDTPSEAPRTPMGAVPGSVPGLATSPGPESTSPAPASPTAAPSSGQGGALLLVFDTGQRVTLALGTAINLGRRPSASEPTDQLVAVDDPEGTVSKFHARLEHSRGHTWVTDQGSTNGTELLDEDGATRLEPGVRTLIEDGMRTRLGNRSFTVSVLLDPAPLPETSP